MAEKKSNEEAPEAAEKKEKKVEEGEVPAEKAARSPGPAPLGGGDQTPNEAAGSKVKDVDDEGDPGRDREDVRRQSSREARS